MSNENRNYLDSVVDMLKTSHLDQLNTMLKKFAALNPHDSSAKVNFVSQSLDDVGLLNQPRQVLKEKKSNEKSDECRNQGNQFFAKKDYTAAVIKYNESLCLAESSKNLALAYENRSAACFELQMYSSCIQNIELAKSHEYPAQKMEKLDQRAKKCRQLIAEGAETDENMLKPIVADFLKLSHLPHPKLPYIANCLDVQYSDELGRHVITKKKLQPGDVVCIESPFFKSLGRNRKYSLCINCMDKNLLNLMPCEMNASVMFCSKRCKDEAFESYYEYKVDIIDEIRSILPNHPPPVFQTAVELFFKSLRICGGSLEKLKAVFDESENNAELTILDVEDPTEEVEKLKAILALSSQESKRKFMTNLKSCMIATLISDLFLKHTRLAEILKTEDDKDFFRSFLYKSSVIAAINGMSLSDDEIVKEQTPLGVLPFVSLFSHSCDPNVVVICNNGKITLIVKQLIKSGEQLCICYWNTFINDDYETRQVELKGGYYFDCKCEACMKRYPTKEGLRMEVELEKASSVVLALQLYEINEDSKKMLLPIESVEIEAVRSLFKKIKDFLINHQNLHPCQELNSVQIYFEDCLKVFLKSKLSQFSARLKK